jgi:hypothetical protein
VAEAWLERVARITRSEKDYKMARGRVTAYLVPFMGCIEAARLVTDDLMGYRGWLATAHEMRRAKDGTLKPSKRKLSIQTQRHIPSDLRALCLWAEQRGMVQRGLVPKRKLLPRVRRSRCGRSTRSSRRQSGPWRSRMGSPCGSCSTRARGGASYAV